MVKGTNNKGQGGTSNSQVPPQRRVSFDLSGERGAIATEVQEPDAVSDEGTETPARAPSFFIGKPLKDYDYDDSRRRNKRVGHETELCKGDKQIRKKSCKFSYLPKV